MSRKLKNDVSKKGINKSYGFWEECVIVIRTTYKQELCSLRFQQLLPTSVVPKRKQYGAFDRYISETNQGETDQ